MTVMNSGGGKGSGRRPSQVTTKEVDDNWDRIFGKKDSKEKKQEVKEEQSQTGYPYFRSTD